MLNLRGKETSDWDKKYVSELSKKSSLTYKKLADHDRIPLKDKNGESWLTRVDKIIKTLNISSKILFNKTSEKKN